MTADGQQRRLEVLLVDDERDFVDTLRDRLVARGMCAEAAYGGEEALAKLAHQPPAVMVLDLKMPVVGGIEVLRRMRELETPTEVIVLTGHATESEMEEAQRLGARRCVRKPVDIRELKRMIERAGNDVVRAGQEDG